ncbi:non-ribosomal peptide synthetase [Kitasatospora viridis]|uniref:Phenyloxazoline synthase MbtB n=1 Tax=Kitasatospora viridis TaxID=281105 RepID=A0A561T625_9ACTN|nr:non-ribosomal peptide synthetase [Kitasatospora viridis]TWF82566.1 amino acid adenylation domain-containing protein [Kitasatospora viridis]
MPEDRGIVPVELPEAVAELLGRPGEAIDPDENLIALGLDSLAMMRLAGRLRRSGLELGFADLVAEPTLAAWARLTGSARAAAPPVSAPAPVDESEPFELALMQHAYWVGRSAEQQLGGVASHFYNEFDGASLGPERLAAALHALVARHGMLRARILDDGRQRIEPTGGPRLRVHDLRGHTAETARCELDELRRQLSHRQLDIAAGEVFDLQLSLLPDAIRPAGTRLHLNLDMVAADALSVRILLADLARLYAGEELPPLDYGFARYLAERRAARATPARTEALAADRDHWRRHLPDLPGAPRLPLVEPAPDAVAHRRHRQLDQDQAARLGELARTHGLTPAMALAAVFAETLTAFSAEPRFLLNLPLFDREPLHPEVDQVIGDFTSSVLLAWDGSGPGGFAERAARLQARFHADVAHAGHSGVEVLRDASRLHGERVLAPVVYTSALGLGELFPARVREAFGEPSWVVSQGPQVWLDAQVTELAGGLLVNWDFRADAFAPGVPDTMFEAYSGLLDRLLAGPGAWTEPVPALLSREQRSVRDTVNDTAGPRPEQRLHDGFFARAAEQPERVALRWGASEFLTYGELARRSLGLAGRLVEQGVGPGDLVAVSLPKGPDQVVAVLGVLAAGAAYLPLGVDQPEARRERICAAAGVRLVLDRLVVGERLAAPVAVGADELAYVIYTSGSTGEPKGVEITHAAAVNTVADVNERFEVGERDRVLAVSALDFDLSVYDLFGPLSVGGSVVLIEEDERRDARRWLELVRERGVTLWNTVPALLDMLLTAAEAEGAPDPLRLVLVSGDWVGLDLPGRLRALRPGCRFVALGGATEAAIWSNAFEVAEVEPGWRSIPYGFPLRNQCYRVTDELGRDCPDWVTGQLWIGGAGVARGYRNAPELTERQFVGGWYRTGDLGRYWPDGTLEFLGRADRQVKVRGHRIELGEIEAALTEHPGVGQAVAVVGEDGRLGAVVTGCAPQPVPDWRALAEAAGGQRAEEQEPLDLAELRAFLADRLPAAMLPERLAVLPELPLTPNGKVDRSALRRVLAARQVLRSGPAVPAGPAVPLVGEVERRVAAAWAEILGVPEVGREHDFFALGGDSLLATRLIGRLKADGFGEVKLAELFRRPALADFAATLHQPVPARPAAAALIADPARRLEPFPLTEVQRAYWLGRGEEFTLGGVGCHFYREYDVAELDLARLEAAVDRLVRRHEMLRAVVDERGDQRILPEVPHYRIEVTEAGADVESAFAELWERGSHQVFDPSAWPLFAIRAVRTPDGTRLGIGVDNIVLDALSVLTFYAELGALYDDPQAELPSVDVSFRDYVLATDPAPEALAAAREYWDTRLPELPPAPQLPLAVDPSAVRGPQFTRREAMIGGRYWRAVADRAREHGLTQSAVLLAAFGEVLGRWSARADLTLNLTLFDRQEVHPDIAHVLGDFTSLLLVPSRPEPGGHWLAQARRVQQELWGALDHREVSAVRLLRELARLNGEPEVAMPVVFTSALGVGGEPASALFADYVAGVSQTPQVWLDHQVTETRDGGVRLHWDAVEELFPSGLLDAMFDAYLALLDWLGHADWDAPLPDLLPREQREVRAEVNATAGPRPERRLHDGFFECARRDPAAIALRWDAEESLDYGELARLALGLAGWLVEQGVGPGDLVAVSLPKGPDQVVAVLGVLAAGAAYLPLGVDQPELRRERICAAAGVRLVLDRLVVGEPLAAPVAVSADELAYVIYTSGSTGEPKGVEITHAAAVNTVADVNERFEVGERDRVLAVSALDFDLSVYDLFGPLSAGGSVVLIEEDERRDARRWLELAQTHGVTVWNSVPALLDMLLTVAEGVGGLDALRLVLVSGDWVGLDLPGRLRALRPDCRFVALGGATEAAIWSNAFEVAEVEPGWRSIPYGFPLRNQRYRVTDEFGRDCPDWVAGQLWIGGAGVACGYRNAPELTERQFVGGWYRTGDLGRYWPDGTLEFLGRADRQVKVRGYRIELGEIEAALTDHPGVAHAVADVTGAARRMVAAVVPARPVFEGGIIGVAPDADRLAAEAGAIELEGAAVASVLVELLGLNALGDGVRLSALAARLELAEEQLPVLRVMLGWLVERKVLVEEADGFRAGPELAEIAEPSAPTAEFGRLVEQVRARAVERLADYRRILAGRLDPAVLLDDERLSPLALAELDPGAAEVRTELARRIAESARRAGHVLEVAVLGGRDGRGAAALLRLLPPERIRLTLLDASPTMLAAATARLAELPHQTECRRLVTVPDDLRHRFDVVLADNALHRYPDPAQGPALAALLTRRGGTVLAVERAALTPLTLLTGAVLDRGYAAFDPERRRAGSPMLPAARWAELLGRAGLRGLGHRPIGSAHTELLWATRPATAPDLDPAAVAAHAAGRLPGPMVPERIEVLPWLPLSANGKVDRKALAELLTVAREDEPEEPPRSGLESEVAALWAELLGSPVTGRERGFFALGGDSLLATRFVEQVRRRYGVELPMRRLFGGRSLAGVAQVLGELVAPGSEMEDGEL